MSALVNQTLSWILLWILVKTCRAFSIYPSSGDWTCNAGHVLVNHTLSGGIQAGQFKKVGFVLGMTECIHYCCNDERCDVALMVKRNCYLVSCNNEVLCRQVPAQSTDLSPQISFVTHLSSRRRASGFPALHTFLSTPETRQRKTPASKRTTRRAHSFRLHPKNEIGVKRVQIQSTQSSNKLFSKPTKAELFFEQQSPTTWNEQSVETEGCYPATIHKSVSLRYGPDSGEFYDYGKIGDMRLCVNLCCKDKQCDVSFMVDKTCYTVSCYTLEKCEMVPASKSSKLTSQLAYVIKNTDIDRQQKLRISKKHERYLAIKREEETDQPWMFDKMRDRGPTRSSKVLTTEEPNIPEKFTKKCRHNNILINHAMIGGQRAGIYTFRGFTPGFNACLDLCCADLFCDAAFLLGKRCYSVQCYKNGKCAGRPAKSKKMSSALAFIQRSDDGLDLSEKRTAIPGLLPTDHQYTVWLNITNEEYKEEMVDAESLEFLNFAETLRGMINGLYGDVEGFKYVDIMKFKPKILVAVFNLTTDKSTNPKVLLQKIVDVLRKGELRTHDEPSARLSVDVRGFKFLTAQGENMVCLPEYNYDVHWPLGVYGTFVSIPCPRKANGLTTRTCIGTEVKEATWAIPDFSDCVTDKYESLLREVQLLSSTSIHTPDLTTASIIDRLLQLTVQDTYGAKPPKAFQAINNLEQDGLTTSKLPKTNPEEQVRFVEPVPSKEVIPVDQLKSYLRKMGLSTLLGKTNKPDMLSLYKTLSSSNSIEEDSSKPELVKGSSIKYPNPKIEKMEDSPVIGAQPLYQSSPTHSDSDLHSSFNPSLKANPVDIMKSHKQVHWWGPPKPIGELGAESPVLTNIGDPISLVMSPEELKTIHTEGAQELAVPSRTSHSHNYNKHHPATIERVDYEPIVRSPSNGLDTLAQQPNDVHRGLLTSQDLMNLSPEELHQTIATLQEQQQQNAHQRSFQTSGQNKAKDISRHDLASYFTNTEMQPNGIPMFQNRRDEPSYPNSDEIKNINDFQHSIRKRNTGDEEFDQLLRMIEHPHKSMNRRRSVLDVESDTVELMLNDNENSEKELKRKRLMRIEKLRRRRRRDVESDLVLLKRNLDSSVLESLSLPDPSEGMTHMYGTATLTEIPMPQNTKEQGGVERSNFPHYIEPPRKFSQINDNLDSTVEPSLEHYMPYRKVIEKPTIVDIPTGEVVHNPLEIASVNFEQNKSPLSVKSLSYENNKETKLETAPVKNTVAVSSSEGKLSNPKVHVTADSSESHNNVFNVNSAKVTSSVDVNCKLNGRNCPSKSSLPLLAGSKVMAEHQVNEPQEPEPEWPKKETTTTTTTRSTRNIPSTTSVPAPTMPTADPYKQDIDETQPEDEVPQKISPTTPAPQNTTERKPIISITTIEKKPKPEISITVVNKTKEVTLEPTTPKPTEASTTPKTTTKKPRKKEESDLVFSYDKGVGGERAPMFGGDLMITLNIAEEITKYMQDQDGGPTLQEVEEFLQASSAVLDERNEMEWKNTVKKLKVLREEDTGITRDLSDEEVADWRVMRKQKSKENADILMGFVDTIETYGKTASKLFSHYNVKLQQPIITKNIIMQIRIIVVEELLEKKDGDVLFPDYAEDQRLMKWGSGVEKISLPASVITDQFEQTKTIHIVFFRIKNIALLQRLPRDQEDNDNKDIVDESPIKVASQILSMTVEPEFPSVLKLPVSIKFANQDLSQADLPHDCAYWNSSKKAWEDNGCELTFTNSTVTTCQCNHLTTFSVLVDGSSKAPVTTTTKKPDLIPETTPKTPKPDNEKKPVEIKGGSAKIEEEKTTTTTRATSTAATTSTTTAAPKTKASKQTKSDKKWLWILLAVLLLLLLIVLIICCCCCCCKWYKKRKKETETKGLSRSSFFEEHDSLNDAAPETEYEVAGGVIKSGWLGITIATKWRSMVVGREVEEPAESSDNTNSLIDKGNVSEGPAKGLVKPGSTTTSRTTSSPEPGQSPGWRKLMSNAQHPKQMLLKEKAILFKDYVQPYHFLAQTKDRPNTSAESIYGSTIGSAPPVSRSEMSSSSPRRNKRVYEPKQRRLPPKPRLKVTKDSMAKSPSPVSSPEVNKREPRRRTPPEQKFPPLLRKRQLEENVVPQNLTDAHSMEWDPYLDNKQNKSKSSRRKRNISPISEEGEESVEPKASLEAQNGSEDGSSDTSYPDSVSRTVSESSASSPVPQYSDKKTSTSELTTLSPRKSSQTRSDSRHTTNR